MPKEITQSKLANKKEIYAGDIAAYYKLTRSYCIVEEHKKRYKTFVETSNTESFQDESKESLICNKNSPNQSLLLYNLAVPVSKYIKKIR